VVVNARALRLKTVHTYIITLYQWRVGTVPRAAHTFPYIRMVKSVGHGSGIVVIFWYPHLRVRSVIVYAPGPILTIGYRKIRYVHKIIRCGRARRRPYAYAYKENERKNEEEKRKK
jgi:hypothetical protein